MAEGWHYLERCIELIQTDRNALLNEGKIITRWGTHEFAHSKKNWVEDGAYWDFVEVYKDDLYANRSPLANAMAISATQRKSGENINVFKSARDGSKAV